MGKGLIRLEGSTLPLVRCHGPVWLRELARYVAVYTFDEAGRGPTVPSVPENDGSLAKNGASANSASGRSAVPDAPREHPERCSARAGG